MQCAPNAAFKISGFQQKTIWVNFLFYLNADTANEHCDTSNTLLIKKKEHIKLCYYHGRNIIL